VQVTVDCAYRDLVADFFRKNPTISHSILLDDTQIVIEIDELALPADAAGEIKRHFRYLELFIWSGTVLEDVIFWERAHLFDAIATDFMASTGDLNYDTIAPIEARGFLLAGMLAPAAGRPLLPIRKYKPCFGRFPGARSPFTNWKGEHDELFVFQRERFAGARVLIVDDLIDTGNSLRAALKALPAVGAKPIGAFYLCNAMEPGHDDAFSIPIRCFVRRGPVPALSGGPLRPDRVKEYP
jgi:adenine/guanine phosphoribosyltransferase-like PRPP-binding protein